MKLFGTVKYWREFWHIEAAPHVLIRLKRVFGKANELEFGKVRLSDTPENCRDLLWFIDRYPMAIHDSKRLRSGAEQHQEKEQLVHQLVEGIQQPRDFKLALPLREYQRVAADLILKTKGLLVGDDLGLGKSAVAIATFVESRTLPAMVVTMTHLTWQWQNEIKKFLPDLRTHILKKGTPYDIRTEDGFPDVVICNYHKLRGWAETLAPLMRSIVFDEVQELRRGSISAKGAAAYHLADHAEVVCGLSATPVMNYGAEIYNVFHAIKPGELGSCEEFTREWCYHYQNRRLKDPRAFGSYLRERGLMIRRTRKEVGRELPDLIKVPHHVQANTDALDAVAPRVAELAKLILADKGETARGEKFRAAEELNIKLRQATGIGKAPYVGAFVKMLLDNSEKVVLFGWHRECYTIWEEQLKEYRPAFYTGTESPKQKEESKRRFIEDETNLLIMSLRSGAGLDGLQGYCRTVVFGELDWSPGVHEQGIGRVYRDGQEEKVAAYFLITDHGSDPVIADILQIKKEQVDGIRDPQGTLLEKLDTGGDHTRRLAEAYLKQQGKTMKKLTLNIVKEQEEKHYAAIGARDIPKKWQKICRLIGGYLAQRGWTLHTGAAPGADQCYAEGAVKRGGSVVLHLPWRRYEQDWVQQLWENNTKLVGIEILDPQDKEAQQSIVEYHPTAGKLDAPVQLLHGRNYYIVKNAKFVIALPKNGKGGTMQGVRIAEGQGTPVVRLDQQTPKEAQGEVDRLAAVKP